ncbi:STAS domain-containing protein [Actinoplanes sp. NBC_00393]|jgi:anti-sigma B factor antagonist|uniref:STAS domain-containing protein n=1 Tax=Actinoplanes sp. NBC_00393 TaxID=2975953 RepID=UPI002E21E38E
MSNLAAVTFQEDADSGVLSATISGELDLAESDEIRDSLAAAAANTSCRYLLVDVSDVTLIDSYAMGALVSARNSAASVGVTLTLVDPSPPVRKAIEVTGLADVFGLTGPR